jgi:hypothetical protein
VLIRAVARQHSKNNTGGCYTREMAEGPAPRERSRKLTEERPSLERDGNHGTDDDDYASVSLKLSRIREVVRTASRMTNDVPEQSRQYPSRPTGEVEEPHRSTSLPAASTSRPTNPRPRSSDNVAPPQTTHAVTVPLMAPLTPMDHLNPRPRRSDNVAPLQTTHAVPVPLMAPMTPIDHSAFLLKKDLLMSRLTNFDDTPENYLLWKESFLMVSSEFNVSLSEELDLLVKYLGPESRRYATSIRSANIRNPERGLERLWERLDERYGSPELLEAALKRRVESFQKITNKEMHKLYDLTDLLSEIEAAMENPALRDVLAYFNSSTGIMPIVSKLPYNLQERWVTHATDYKRRCKVSFPPFSYFVQYVNDMARMKNDPSLQLEAPVRNANVKKTTLKPADAGSKVQRYCPLHNSVRHSIVDCNTFKQLSVPNRRDIMKQKGYCFSCCARGHIRRDCVNNTTCTICGDDKHHTLLHDSHGEEPEFQSKPKSANTMCTQICANTFQGKSCAKIVLVRVYNQKKPQNAKNVYAIIDDQSNRSLIDSHLVDQLKPKTEVVSFTMNSCNGQSMMQGREVDGLVIESLDKTTKYNLQTLLECDQIPNDRDEIPTPEIAHYHPHLSSIANHIPKQDCAAPISLLIGRDAPELHHVYEQITDNENPKAPYAQRLSLGWVIVGETCLGKIHETTTINVNKICIIGGSRPSVLTPCTSRIKVKEIDVFSETPDDEKPGMSMEDREFIQTMNDNLERDSEGTWIAPLPFKADKPTLPNNRSQAMKRARNLTASLRKDAKKKDHFFTFMQKIIENGHAEEAPEIHENKERWYLPLFGVYHPKKPDQIRCVFDAAAKYNGISLNDVLLTGPDLTNSLLGILLRFRQEPVAIVADIQQMFHNFKVREDHRDYLRFLWHKNNDIECELIEYRMCVHVFGNSSSPAVATYALRRIAEEAREEYGDDMTEFVTKNFYVDDGLISTSCSHEAQDLIKRTQEALQNVGNLRLHKIASNSKEVMESLPSDDLAKEIRDLDLDAATLPTQRSLGISWDLSDDTFTFKVNADEKPTTRRGMLSTVNSLYDPLGFVCPVTIQGKLFLRELSGNSNWDDAISDELSQRWQEWKQSLSSLNQLKVQRCYFPTPSSDASKTELHIFSDASEKAIAAVVYLKAVYADNVHVQFIIGKAKVAPTHAVTIPRLELCAALLAVELFELVYDQTSISFDSVTFHSDSKVVLGYLNNRTRRFHTYVANRIHRILSSTKPSQWTYVHTATNPADIATRTIVASQLLNSTWLRGPTFLSDSTKTEYPPFELVEPDQDKELRKDTAVCCKKLSFGVHRFERFSSWNGLTKAISLLQHVAKSHCESTPEDDTSSDRITTAEIFVLQKLQQEVYASEVDAIEKGNKLKKTSPLYPLNPILDENKLLRVGGRLTNARILNTEKNPIIIPGSSHIARLIIRKYHESIQHQGRHLTEGAVRSAGFWIVGGKRAISSLIHQCVSCRKGRAKPQEQKMGDLPSDRLQPGPPFTSVGVDTFGPWSVAARRTRGGWSNSKRWAILFSCLTTRAVHIEVVEELSSSSFINALRRFTSLRGPVKVFRSDRGTNFVGAAQLLNMNCINVEDDVIRSYLDTCKASWIFNVPHASHMGGAWERMIGIARRILDNMINNCTRPLSHEVLTTFMAEVCGIMNSRPLIAVSSDPDQPEILTPATLLTQKIGTSDMAIGEFSAEDMYKAQWRRVQCLADTFWKRWRTEYLHTLQTRRKWAEQQRNIQKGDVVLLKDKNSPRISWPLGIIESTIQSADDLTRKVTVRVMVDGKPRTYLRPISDIIVLLENV